MFRMIVFCLLKQWICISSICRKEHAFYQECLCEPFLYEQMAKLDNPEDCDTLDEPFLFHLFLKNFNDKVWIQKQLCRYYGWTEV
jgi:hypothetical protein